MNQTGYVFPPPPGEIHQLDENGMTALMRASEAGNLQEVERLLARKAEVNQTGSFGRSALIMAAGGSSQNKERSTCAKRGREHLAVMKCLLSHRADPNHLAIDHRSALYEATAAFSGSSLGVRLLMEYGANPDEPDIYGATPLMIAATDGYLEIVQLLLNAGVYVNAQMTPTDTEDFVQAEYRYSALLCASHNGYTQTVKELLKSGAIPDLPDFDGVTPLTHAILRGQHGIVEALLQAGARVDYPCVRKRTSLFVASQTEDEEIAHMVFQKAAALDVDLAEMLWLAVERNDLNDVRRYLENGASPDHHFGGVLGLSCLIVAIQNENPEIVRALLDYGASPHLPDKRWYTPVFHAAEIGNLGILRQLLEAGADPNLPNRFGFFPLAASLEQGHPAVFELLWERVRHPQLCLRRLFLQAVSGGDAIWVNLLLKKGLNPNRVLNFGKFPLIYAVRSGNYKMVEGILKAGGQATQQISKTLGGKYELGDTALHEIANRGDLKIAHLLVENGACPNALNAEGKTPSHYAVERGHQGLVSFFAHCNQRDAQATV
ncbi:MAG: ankyrin repeat domain-containing protein [Bdellovibrio sp.]|nr:ankyrin repeat domain-containing protein [Bdellovibrio sp.]